MSASPRLSKAATGALLVAILLSFLPTGAQAFSSAGVNAVYFSFFSNYNPSLYAEPDAGVEVTVSGTGAVPAGSVDFYSSATLLGTVALDGTGKAFLDVTNLPVGQYDITAHYSGDTNYPATQSSPFTHFIYTRPTVLSLTSSANPITAGQPVTLTAVVTTGIPTVPVTEGTISINAYGNVLCSATIDAAGQVTCVTTALSTGIHLLDASYYGSNYLPSYANIVQSVNPKMALIEIQASPTTVPLGQTFDISLTVSAPPGNDPVPTGFVSLSAGATFICGSILDAQGTAHCTSPSTLSVGSHSLLATYSGDINYMFSASQPVTVTVGPGETGVTLVNLGADMPVLGESVMLSATVNVITGTQAQTICVPICGGPPIICPPLCGPPIICPPFCGPLPSTNLLTPTGQIEFKEGTTTLCTTALDVYGNATCETTLPTAGTHLLQAHYSGEATYEASSGSLSLTVQPATTQLTVTPAALSVVQGEPLGFNVTVAAATSGAGVPSGQVTVGEGSNSCVAQLTQGAGSCSLTFDTPGTHAVSATYAGDGNFSMSTAVTSVAVDSAPVPEKAQITLTIPAGNLKAGQSLTLTAEVSLVQVTAMDSASTAAVCELAGDVSFYDNETLLGTVPLAADCTATYVIASLTSGAHLFSASYDGESATSTSQPMPVNVDSPTALETPDQPTVGPQLFLPALAH